MLRTTLLLLSLLPSILLSQTLSGELRQWHTVTLTFSGPATSESASPNPFTDYRMAVTFTQGNETFVVPGYFAADGDAAESSADSGDQWRVHFTPPATGTWNWEASFRTGSNVAIDLSPTAGTPASFDGQSGSFTILPTDKNLPDNRARGRLEYVNQRYRQYRGNGEWLINIGADAPENFLAYYEFDQTRDDGGSGTRLTSTQPYGNGYNFPGDGLHHFDAHLQDWNTGDPTWQSGKGKAIIGALNYLASEGLNAFSGLLWNVGGDGDDVWPYTDDNELYRFDCSKLDQWEIVFSHAEQLGLLFHVKLFETENDEDMSDDEWKLYFREMVARFGHHLAWEWNLGEENTLSPAEVRDRAHYLRDLLPYPNPHVVIHTFGNNQWRQSQWGPQLGDPTTLSGISVQVGRNDLDNVLEDWLAQAENSGHIWVANWDEQNSASTGVSPDPNYPDNSDDNHDGMRQTMWEGFILGMEGMKCYFGYNLIHDDLECEDFRSRDAWWDYMRIARQTLERVPFWQMDHDPNADPSNDNFVLTDGQDYWLIYAEDNDDVNINLPAGNFETISIRATDGLEVAGGMITSGDNLSNGYPAGEEWVRIIRREEASAIDQSLRTVPAPQLRDGYFHTEFRPGDIWQVFDLTGRLVAEGKVRPDGRIPVRDTAGIYLYQTSRVRWVYGTR